MKHKKSEPKAIMLLPIFTQIPVSVGQRFILVKQINAVCLCVQRRKADL